MFKNNVFKLEVDFIEWFKGAAVRAIKTTAQTAAALLTVSVGTAGVNEVAWLNILSVSAVAGIYSVITSIAGIPEAPANTNYGNAEKANDGDDEYFHWPD